MVCIELCTKLVTRFGGSIDTCTAHHNELFASSLGLSQDGGSGSWQLCQVQLGLDSLDHRLNLLQFPHVVVKDDIKFASLGGSTFIADNPCTSQNLWQKSSRPINMLETSESKATI